jgi:hypothetical protein
MSIAVLICLGMCCCTAAEPLALPEEAAADD